MNIVIAGAGAVGTHLAKMLSRQEHNIMLIDTNQDKLEDLESQIDILSIVGSCTSIGALKDAEVGKCDLYIAVNPQEDQNINSAILAKKLGAKRTIARVNNSEYLEIENAEYLRSIGIDSLIYPERLAAEEIVASLKQIGSRQMHEFSDGRLQLLGIKLWDNALILNHTLIKMAEIYGADQFRIVAIKRHNHTIIPRGNDELKYGDLVFIVTRPSFIPNVFALCGKEQFEIKNIVIVGASRIGIKTASLLEKNYHVKIIEKDREKCIQLADKLKSTLVINGDGRDLTLLREEGIKNVDAFISLQGQRMGTSSKNYDIQTPQNLTGYYIKKFDNADVAFKDYYSNSTSESGDILLRLPDLLLASAEAWNEYLDKPDDRVYAPLDRVRVRAGIDKVRDAWNNYARNPQKVTTQAGMREIIRQEWNIEFAFEGRRFYNLRRWMTAHEELNTPLYGWNILGDTEERFFNNYTKPIVVWKKRSFTAPRDYLFPIGSEEVMISGCVQNPDW